jgi:hypothetical protein
MIELNQHPGPEVHPGPDPQGGPDAQGDADAPAASVSGPSGRMPAAAAFSAIPLQGTGDTTVDAVLDQLSTVPGMTVREHGNVYAKLHDGLLEALDGESANQHGPRP